MENALPKSVIKRAAYEAIIRYNKQIQDLEDQRDQIIDEELERTGITSLWQFNSEIDRIYNGRMEATE